MGAVPRAKAGVGSAVNDSVRQVGGALGIAVLISLLNSVYSGKISDAVSPLPDVAAHGAQDSIQGAYAVAAELPATQSAAIVRAADQAYIDAMTTTVTVAAIVVIAGALLAAIAMPDRGRTADDDAPDADTVADDDAHGDAGATAVS